eukprot:RCo034909
MGLFQGLFAATLYAFCGVAMTITNKWIVTTWEFRASNALLFGQMAVSSVVLQALWRKRLVELPVMDWNTARFVLWLSLCYLLNVGCALAALARTSVPVYNMLKRLAPFPTMLVDFAMRGEKFPVSVQLSVLTMVCGAVIGGNGDLDFNRSGYVLALMSCCLQALYLVLTSRVHDVGLSSHAIMYYNSLFSLPVLTLLVLCFEVPMLRAYSYYEDPVFLVCLAACLTMGSLLNFSLLHCTTSNSALTTVVVGQVKALVTTILGFFLFGKVNINATGLLGIALNTAGGVAYAIAKHRHRHSG